jgi:hypothetical protein
MTRLAIADCRFLIEDLASFAVLCVSAWRILSVENSQRKDAKDRKAR